MLGVTHIVGLVCSFMSRLKLLSEIQANTQLLEGKQDVLQAEREDWVTRRKGQQGISLDTMAAGDSRYSELQDSA